VKEEAKTHLDAVNDGSVAGEEVDAVTLRPIRISLVRSQSRRKRESENGSTYPERMSSCFWTYQRWLAGFLTRVMQAVQGRKGARSAVLKASRELRRNETTSTH
jgi:hypothetical protein